MIATKWEIDGDIYTGALDGERLLGAGKLAAVKEWAADADVDLGEQLHLLRQPLRRRSAVDGRPPRCREPRRRFSP